MQRKRLVLHHNIIIGDELAYFYSESVAKIKTSSLKK